VIDGRNKLIPAGEPRRIAAEAARAERARQIAKVQEDLDRLAEKFGPLDAQSAEVKAVTARDLFVNRIARQRRRRRRSPRYARALLRDVRAREEDRTGSYMRAGCGCGSCVSALQPCECACRCSGRGRRRSAAKREAQAGIDSAVAAAERQRRGLDGHGVRLHRALVRAEQGRAASGTTSCRRRSRRA
jgi:hypothetical protein